LIAFAENFNLGISTFTPQELNSAVSRQSSVVSLSNAAFKATGAYAVAEPALLAAGADTNCEKQKRGNVTVAVAERVNIRS
jgi:cobalamin biosynthesis protein CbiG